MKKIVLFFLLAIIVSSNVSFAVEAPIFDVNGDGKTGLAEAIYALKVAVNESTKYDNCNSCHGTPPDVGAHATHNALSGVTDQCSTCHEGGGYGTDGHDNSVVDVSIASTCNAKSGSAVRNTNGTCSNVSCHGGQDTPNMASGSLNVDTDCTSCHASGSTQYNSYNSGRHSTHAGSGGYYGGACTGCHDTTALAVDHFAGLDTQTFEGNPASTIKSSLNYSSGTPSCALCHGARNW